jgi:hypothetical protein
MGCPAAALAIDLHERHALVHANDQLCAAITAHIDHLPAPRVSGRTQALKVKLPPAATAIDGEAGKVSGALPNIEPRPINVPSAVVVIVWHGCHTRWCRVPAPLSAKW